MIAPRSLWLACADCKPIVRDDSWEKALAAYDAEMDEAEMRAARAVFEHASYQASVKSHTCYREDECDTGRSKPLQELSDYFGRFAHWQEEVKLRAIIEKTREHGE